MAYDFRIRGPWCWSSGSARDCAGDAVEALASLFCVTLGHVCSLIQQALREDQVVSTSAIDQTAREETFLKRV